MLRKTIIKVVLFMITLIVYLIVLLFCAILINTVVFTEFKDIDKTNIWSKLIVNTEIYIDYSILLFIVDLILLVIIFFLIKGDLSDENLDLFDKKYHSMNYSFSIMLALVVAFSFYGTIPSVTTSKDYESILISSIADSATLVDLKLQQGNSSFVRSEFIDNNYTYGEMQFSLKPFSSIKSNFDFDKDDLTFEPSSYVFGYYSDNELINPKVEWFNLEKIENLGKSYYLSDISNYPILDKDTSIIYGLGNDYDVKNTQLNFTANMSANHNMCILISLYPEGFYSEVDKKPESYQRCFFPKTNQPSLLNKDKLELSSKIKDLYSKEITVNFNSHINKKSKVVIRSIHNENVFDEKLLKWTLYDEEIKVNLNTEKIIDIDKFCLEGYHKADPSNTKHIIYTHTDDWADKNNVRPGACPR